MRVRDSERVMTLGLAVDERVMAFGLAVEFFKSCTCTEVQVGTGTAESAV